MYVRLEHMGYRTHLLRTQYRCHPDLSAAPNTHFYGARLIDGCSPESRASLLGEGVPPLIFCDNSGGQCQQAKYGRSSYNTQEVCGQ